MTHIGDIDDVVYRVTVEFKHTPQYVFEHVGSKVANVRIVVDRWATAVQTGLAIGNRLELASLARIGVIQVYCHIAFSCCLQRCVSFIRRTQQ